MAWTKIDDPVTEWSIITVGGWFKTAWFQGWFQDLPPAIWTKEADPITVWTVL